MPDMPRPRPPFIMREPSRHGTVRWYFRRGDGPRIRLPDAYGTDAFWLAYNAALGQKPERKAPATGRGSIAWLVAEYKRSGAFTSLSARTRRVRDGFLQKLVAENGEVLAADITRADLIEARDRRAAGDDKHAGGPEAGNAWLKTARVLLDFARDRGIIGANPADKIAPLKGNPEGFHTWTLDEVERYEAKHLVGTRARLALDLILYTGLRRQDIVRLGRQHIRDGVLTIRPSKTARTSAVTVTLPLLEPLARSIEAATARGECGDLTFIVTDFGKPFTDAGFGNRMRKWCDEAGVPGSSHGLRKVAATRAAEAGATTHELMAMFGWTTTKEAERYTRAAERKRMSMRGAAKMSPAPHAKVRGSGENH